MSWSNIVHRISQCFRKREREFPDGVLVGMFFLRITRLLHTGMVKQIEDGKVGNVEIYYKSENDVTTVVFPEVNRDGIDAFALNYRLIIQANDAMSLKRMKPRVRALTCAPEIKAEFLTAVKSLNT